MDIGLQIKNRRKELGLTQEELAKKLNVTRSTVSNWEVGRNYPDIQILSQVSSVLDIDMNDFFCDNDPAEVDATSHEHFSLNHRQLLSCVLIPLLVLLGAAYFIIFNHFNVKSTSQIRSVSVSGNDMVISLKLPFYMSADGCMGGTEVLQDGSTADVLTLETKISLNHTEQLIIPAPKESIDSIVIVDDDREAIYSIPYQKALDPQ